MLYILYNTRVMKNQTSPLSRDGQCESPWQQGLTNLTQATKPNPDTVYDCLVIGGGITGITAALLLQQAGKKIILADAYTIGFGTTGGTSAHINTFADTSYKDTESAFGEKGAKLFAEAVNGGLKLISDQVKQYNIDCDFAIKPGYIYAEDDDQIKQLQNLYNGTVKVGVPIEYVTTVPVPIPYHKAVRLDGQAQFQPFKYLQAIAQEFVNAGGVILENTRIGEIISEGGLHTTDIQDGSIKAKSVIYATHYPSGINVFNFKCAPYRSYVIGVELADNAYPDALIYDLQEPYHYIRTHEADGQRILLVGGNDHKTGHDDPAKAFADLETYTRKYYNVLSVKYSWSSQYYIPVDGLPYVGQMPMRADGIYCATGYNGNGMMLGSISAAILADAILGKENSYAELFSTKRIKPVDGFVEFVKENADVAYHFVADRLSVHETDSLKGLQPGSGEVVEFEGKKIAAYRDELGTLHALSPVCPHAKCIVSFNAEEKSWDCPCHGARFNIDGKILTGPAMHDLEKMDI